MVSRCFFTTRTFQAHKTRRRHHLNLTISSNLSARYWVLIFGNQWCLEGELGGGRGVGGQKHLKETGKGLNWNRFHHSVAVTRLNKRVSHQTFTRPAADLH